MAFEKVLLDALRSVTKVEDFSSSLAESVADDIFTRIANDFGIPYSILRSKYQECVDHHSKLSDVVRCKGTTRRGTACTRVAVCGGGYCSQHKADRGADKTGLRQQRLNEYARLVDSLRREPAQLASRRHVPCATDAEAMRAYVQCTLGAGTVIPCVTDAAAMAMITGSERRATRP